MRRPRRKILLFIGGVTLCVIIVGVLALLRDPLPRMRARRSTLASAVEGTAVPENGYLLTPVRLTASSGLAVELLVRRAATDTGRRLPSAIVLGGHYTGQRAARMLGDTRGLVVVALSYPFTGDPRPDALTFIGDIPQIRAAILDTPPAIMLALDYLLTRPDVDTTRVEAIGVSLGVPFVCIAGAIDRRFTRVWAIHGSGGSYALLEAGMRRSISFTPLRVVAASLANVLASGPQLDAARWVADISPRPFIMVSAEGDERLSRSGVDALYQSARQPKEHIWMSGGHVHADSATISKLVEIVMTRIGGG